MFVNKVFGIIVTNVEGLCVSNGYYYCAVYNTT